MRALLTGVSSFTGCWFAEALAQAGVKVVATCRRRRIAYGIDQRRRIDKAENAGVSIMEETDLGSSLTHPAVAGGERFDLLCLHGAEVGDFRRPDYDALDASTSNVCGTERLLEALTHRGATAVAITSTVFEPMDEAGVGPRGAFNAYGLAKQLTWQTLRFHAERHGLVVGRFVIPHPFGAYEKAGFTSALMGAWRSGEPAVVRRPQLVRDLIHVDLLAARYARFCTALVHDRRPQTLAPSGYVGSLEALARVLAAEVSARLRRPCRLTMLDPPDDAGEPLLRCNAQPTAAFAADWPFERSWQRWLDFYF